MKERPILFSGPMVRAILEGRKTQTRRVVKDSTFEATKQGRLMHEGEAAAWCPYGQPGDRLWVRETWAHDGPDLETARARFEDALSGGETYGPYYRATESAPGTLRWRPSIHMPRWASRITLEVTGVRVERLQEISEKDAQAEGARWKEFGRCGSGFHLAGWSMDDPFPESHAYCLNTAPLAFANYINRLHGGDNWNLKPSNLWAENPWVWVVEFRKI